MKKKMRKALDYVKEYWIDEIDWESFSNGYNIGVFVTIVSMSIGAKIVEARCKRMGA